MSVLSRFSNQKFRQIVNFCKQQVRHGGGGRHPPLAPESVWETKMNIHASQWTKWTSINIFLFWAAVWGIPLACLPIYTTLFKGVPELRAIPEGYEPREEEYQRNLVTRWFITSGFCESEQQRHEELIFNRWEADNSSKRRLLINEVRRVMSEDSDYAGFDWQPFSAHKVRIMNKEREEGYLISGHN